MRNHLDLGMRQLRIGADAVDERRAAGRCREPAFEHHELRAPPDNRGERIQCVGVCEIERLAVLGARPMPDLRQPLGGRDDDRAEL